MTTAIAPTGYNKVYKYKFSILAAIVFTCLCRLVLQGSGSENELSRYFPALLMGAMIGYLVDSLVDNWQQSLSESRKTNSRLAKKIQQQRIREARYVTIFEKIDSILLLIDSATGQVEEANPCACAFYGYSLEQLQQMHISALTSHSRKEIAYKIGQAQSEGRHKLFLTHKMATGEEKDFEVFCQSLEIKGTAVLFWVVSTDRNKKNLQEIIPICAHCKQIRVETGEWSLIEEYLQRHVEVTFSHGLCPSCAHQHYPTLYELQKNQQA